jgi:hypothetical protein
MAGGVLVGDGIWRHIWEIAVSGMGILAAGAVGVVAATLRYALRQFDARTRAQLREVADLQRSNDLGMRQREDDLEKREKALRRGRTVMAIRIASYAKSLDEARDTNTTLRARNVELQLEINEVNDERNQLVVEELFAARQQFTSKAYGHLRSAVGDHRVPAPLGQSRGAEVIRLPPEGGSRLRRIDTP